MARGLTTPTTNNNNKRRHTGTASPSNTNTGSPHCPTGVTPSDKPATPETVRDAAPMEDLTRGNILVLSDDKREINEGEEETTTDDQQLGDNTDVTTSEFFHQNRFEVLLSEPTNSEPERDLSSVRLKLCPSCNKLNEQTFSYVFQLQKKVEWQQRWHNMVFEMAEPNKSTSST